MENKFIVFEGIEACGKSTQVNILAEKLRSHNKKVWVTAEPTSNNPIGKLLREYLKTGNLDNRTASLLFAADRSLHVKEIQEHLNKGEWVLCDRYIGSSLAYQGLENLGYFNVLLNRDFIMPSLTFYIKIDVKTSLDRIKKRNGISECFDKEDLLIKIKDDYETFYKKEKNPNIAIINGEDSIENISAEIFKKWDIWKEFNRGNFENCK